MNGRVLTRLGVGLALIAGLAVFVGERLAVTTDVSHLLPATEDPRLAAIVRALADSELSRTMVVSLRGPDLDASIAAATALAGRIAEHPEVAWVERGPAAGMDEAVYALYFPRRLMFLSSDPERELPDRLSDAGLAAAARALRADLGSATATLTKRLAPADPLMAFRGVLRRFDDARPDTLTVRGDQLVSADGSYAFVFIGTRHSAFDAGAQAPFIAALDAAVADIERAAGHPLAVESSGFHRFSVQSKASIEADITRVSTISSVAVLVIFLVLFGSLRVLALAIAPLVVGLLAGVAAGLAAFGEIHGLTLAFGATLIGVCIDYPLHLFTHHALSPAGTTPRAGLAAVWPGIRLGALTTTLGFAGLAASALPGLREMAVVAIAGVAAALATTRFLLPDLLPTASGPKARQRWLARSLATLLRGSRRRRGAVAALLVGVLVLIAVAIPGARWSDDISQLNRLDPTTLAHDAAVRERISHAEAGRVVVTLGASEEAALGRNDRVAARLDDARRRGVIAGFRSLHTFVWSADLQRRNLAEVERSPDLGPRLAAAFEAAGFNPRVFAPFDESLAAAPPAPLTWADLQRSPLASAVRSFRLDVAGEVGFATFLDGVSDPDALRASVADIPGAVFLDQRAFLEDAYRGFRTRTAELVIIGILTVLAIIALHYRELRTATLAAAPALLACGFTLATLAAFDVELNLLHLVALTLVFAMGVDYGVFLVEGRASAELRESAFLSVVLACVSTVLGFGLLAISTNPAMRALGLTIGIGVLASVVFAVAFSLLLDRKAP